MSKVSVRLRRRYEKNPGLWANLQREDWDKLIDAMQKELKRNVSE